MTPLSDRKEGIFFGNGNAGFGAGKINFCLSFRRRTKFGVYFAPIREPNSYSIDKQKLIFQYL